MVYSTYLVPQGIWVWAVWVRSISTLVIPGIAGKIDVHTPKIWVLIGFWPISIHFDMVHCLPLDIEKRPWRLPVLLPCTSLCWVVAANVSLWIAQPKLRNSRLGRRRALDKAMLEKNIAWWLYHFGLLLNHVIGHLYPFLFMMIGVVITMFFLVMNGFQHLWIFMDPSPIVTKIYHLGTTLTVE